MLRRKMKKIIRTDKEIESEITKLLKDKDNFVENNYGSEAADNGEYEEFFSSHMTRKTLENFVKWLTTENK